MYIFKIKIQSEKIVKKIKIKINYLVQHEADVNKENKHNDSVFTPLFSEYIYGNVAEVKYLDKEFGTDINKNNQYGKIPLFVNMEIKCW